MGRPKGSKNKATLRHEESEEEKAYRKAIIREEKRSRSKMIGAYGKFGELLSPEKLDRALNPKLSVLHDYEKGQVLSKDGNRVYVVRKVKGTIVYLYSLRTLANLTYGFSFEYLDYNRFIASGEVMELSSDEDSLNGEDVSPEEDS